jgi:hypothetical protein
LIPDDGIKGYGMVALEAGVLMAGTSSGPGTGVALCHLVPVFLIFPEKMKCKKIPEPACNVT